MERMSTALCNQLLDTGSLRDIFALGFIKIYGGTVPATADASIGAATLLCTISVASGGTGITFDAAGAVAGVLPKEPTEVWSGVNVATGTGTFYRLVAPGDTGASSTTQPRVQGTIGVGGADMNVGSTTLTSAATFTLNYFTQAFVPS